MNLPALDATQRKAALAAGLLFLFIIFGSMIYMSALRPKFIVPNDVAATIASLAGRGQSFRAGTTFELGMAAGVIALAWALWVLLKTVDKNLATLALCWRIAEGVLWAGLTLLSHLALHIAQMSPLPGGFESGFKQSMMDAVLQTITTGMDTVVLFTGLGSIVFSYLLFKSRYVPRPLAVWGLVTYASMIGYSCAKLVDPSLACYDMIIYTPGGIFEMVIGFWLVVLGLRTSGK